MIHSHSERIILYLPLTYGMPRVDDRRILNGYMKNIQAVPFFRKAA